MKRRRVDEAATSLLLDADTSARLGRIRQHGTAAELIVRRLVTRLGIRYRTKNRDLPGSPDLANRRKGWAVFVHGCFWHAHAKCSRATIPKRNKPFWRAKFAANIARDARAMAGLKQLGFRTLVIWECELRDEEKVRQRLHNKLLQVRRGLK
ncbi:MAG: DNA mismatch endonuclease Vsr [Myxococcales bacterium]